MDRASAIHGPRSGDLVDHAAGFSDLHRRLYGGVASKAEAESANAPIYRAYRAIRLLMSPLTAIGCFCATCYGRQPSRKWPRALSDWILSQMILVIANIARRIISREKWSPIKKGPPMDQQAAYVAAIDGPVKPLKIETADGREGHCHVVEGRTAKNRKQLQRLRATSASPSP